MAKPRIYVDPNHRQPPQAAQSLELDPPAAHHVARVLRLRRGEPIIVFDGGGDEFEATIETVSKQRVSVRVERRVVISRESALSIYLALGLSRGERMDFALQKSVELGVSVVVPMVTERSVVKLDLNRAERRLTHWRQVIRSACEQSGRTRMPALHAPASISELLGNVPVQGVRIVLDPSAPDIPINDPADGSVVLAVGPEGGFTAEEIDRFEQRSFVRLRLGPRVLRTETAAAAAVLFAQLKWGDMG